VIKVYKGGVLDRFPDGGKMSQHMGSLKVGHKLKVQGPVGMHAYLGNGVFTSGSKVLPRASQIGMLAGGTGITPMLQLAMAILKEPDRGTSISLLYANQSEDDILCRDMLDAMQEAHPRRFKVWRHTLDPPPIT
jgi:cytochrome-b5 reductase